MVKSKSNSFWNNHGFEILCLLAFIAIIFFLIFRKQITNYINSKIDDPDFHSLFSVNKPYIHKRGIPKKYETKCRDILEKLFNKSFPSCRPDFMKRQVTGRNLELDGYNHELKLAFEYNGAQHAQFVPKFHKTITDFEQQLQRDKEKRQLCLENNITLIEIPHTIKYDDLENFIITKLRVNGFNF
jgi:hypothetical protein